jgi:hypothetical protein
VGIGPDGIVAGRVIASGGSAIDGIESANAIGGATMTIGMIRVAGGLTTVGGGDRCGQFTARRANQANKQGLLLGA